MRRALLAVLAGVALPMSALAQSAGAIALPTGFAGINVAQCTGESSDPLHLGNKLTVDLTWTVNPGSNVFGGGGTYSLYAANQQPAAGQGTGVSCTVPNATSTTFTTAKVVDTEGDSDILATAATMTKTFSLQSIAAAAGLGCTGSTTSTVYLCVQWSFNGNPTAGFAVNTTTLDPTVPDPPTQPTSTPGDHALHLNCSGTGTIRTASFKALATSTVDASRHFSNQASSCGDLVIDGLVNNEPYTVVVYGLSAAENPSDASPAITATPYPTDDFWNHYKREGGRETGGCSTAAGGTGLLLGLLGLLAIRRRKP